MGGGAGAPHSAGSAKRLDAGAVRRCLSVEMSVLEFAILAPFSLFVIINPFSTVPLFLAMTPNDTPETRVRMVRIACVVATVVMLFFALTGQFIFTVMGIGLPAFQIAGGVILFFIAFEKLRATRQPSRLTAEEEELATEQEDIAITPLAVPLLCGPGAISTVIILQTQAVTFGHTLVLLVAVAVVYTLIYWILKGSSHGAGWINPIMLRVMRRLMGLLFSAVAVQFVVNGIRALDL